MKGGLAALASAAAASIAGCWGGGYFGSYMPPREECQPVAVDINSINWVPAGREIYVGNVRTANCLVSPDWKFARLGDNVYRYNSWTNKMDIYVGRFMQVQQTHFENGLPVLILCNDWIDNGDKFLRKSELSGFEKRQYNQGENITVIGLNQTGRTAKMRLVWYDDGKDIEREPENEVSPGGMIYSRQFFDNKSGARGLRLSCAVELEIDGVTAGRQEFMLVTK